MKLFRFLSFLTIAALTTPSVFAAEQIAPAPSMAAASEKSSDQVLHAIITGDNKMVLKPGKVFTTGNHTSHKTGMELPYLISNPKPVAYPRWALKQGWQGEINIAIEVLLNGKVGRTKVMKSTGHKSLDNAAVKAVQGWVFHPAVENGKQIVTCIQIAIRFQITE